MPKQKTTDPNGNPQPGEPKPKQTKAEKFRRLANKRVPRAVKYLIAVRNLANKSNYEYNGAQAEKLKVMVIEAAQSVVDAFSESDMAAPLPDDIF